MPPKIILKRTSSGKNPVAQLQRILADHAAYVGIPEGSGRQRNRALVDMALNTTGGDRKSRKQRDKLLSAAEQEINNAELLFIHTNGSQARNIPARPVLQPAISAEGNREAIAEELSDAVKAALNGNSAATMESLARAGLEGQNAAREWFTDARNGWPENSPRTIALKGSDRPLIDTGILRRSITYVVK